MSDRYLHQAPCGRCRGPLELWMCRACARPFSWCEACRLARGHAADPTAAGEARLVRGCPTGHTREVDAPALDELAAAGLVALAVAAPRPRVGKPGVLLPEGLMTAEREREVAPEAISNMWWVFGITVFAAITVAGEVGTDLVMPLWALVPFVGFMIAMGWSVWPRFVRDLRAIGLAIAATFLAVWFLGVVATGEELPGEHLRATWRWYLVFGSVAATASAFQFAPDAISRWVAVLLSAFFRARS